MIARLGELRGAVGEQDWDKATRLLAGLRPSLHRIEERLAERLTRILMAPYIHGASELNPLGAQQLLDRFTACTQPLAIDPSWNRFHAIAANQTAQDTETARIAGPQLSQSSTPSPPSARPIARCSRRWYGMQCPCSIAWNCKISSPSPR